MKQVKLLIPEYLYVFYAKVALASGRSPQQVMADALFQAAGRLSLEVLGKGAKEKTGGPVEPPV